MGDRLPQGKLISCCLLTRVVSHREEVIQCIALLKKVGLVMCINLKMLNHVTWYHVEWMANGETGLTGHPVQPLVVMEPDTEPEPVMDHFMVGHPVKDNFEKGNLVLMKCVIVSSLKGDKSANIFHAVQIRTKIQTIF
jgi:hypothetical protein